DRNFRAFLCRLPGFLPGVDWPRRIGVVDQWLEAVSCRSVSFRREHKVFGLSKRELIRQELQNLGRAIIQRNHSAGTRFCLALSDANRAFSEIDLQPAEEP